MWRILTVNIAKEMKHKYNKHLIVPMTIYKPINYDHIYHGFKDIDEELYHFCLIASEETLRKRLTMRGDIIGGWQFQQIDKCVSAFRSNKFEEHIVTDKLNTDDIIDVILKRIGGYSSKD